MGTGTRQEQLTRAVVKDLHQKKTEKGSLICVLYSPVTYFATVLHEEQTFKLRQIKMKLFPTKKPVQYKAQNPFPFTFTFLINIYPQLLLFPNDLPLEYPPNSLFLASHPPNLFHCLKSVLPLLGLILATFPGPVLWYQIHKESKE